DIFYPPGAGSGSTSSGNTSASDDVHSCSDSPPTINLTATDNGSGSVSLTAFVSAGTHPFNDSNYPQFPGTVTFYANGQQISSSAVSDPQDNVSASYTASSDGSVTF